MPGPTSFIFASTLDLLLTLGATLMIHFVYPIRHGKPRHRPQFDSLEGRIALTGDGNPGDLQPLDAADATTMDVASMTQEAPLSIRLIDPAPDSVLPASPLSLVLEFNRPILPDTVGSDVVLFQTDSDGNPVGYVPYELTVQLFSHTIHHGPFGDPETGALPGLDRWHVEHHGHRWKLSDRRRQQYCRGPVRGGCTRSQA